MTANLLRKAVAIGLIVITFAIAVSGCADGIQLTAPSIGSKTVYVTSPISGPTATADPSNPLVRELATLQSAFTAGQTMVTLGSATFPPGSEFVLMTDGGGGSVSYQIQTSANGPMQTVAVAQYFQLVDWKHRLGGRPFPVIVTDGANLVPIMAAVYQDFNGQQLSLQQAEQEIIAGRPVGINHLTAQLIFLQGMIDGRNADGTPKIILYNQVSLMFSSANFTPEAANLG